MKNTMTNEQAWNWLGNRGISVSKHNVRVRGIWAFVRYPGEDEVDYYHLDANGSAEAMDCIRLDDSPFAESDKDKVNATVERITEQFYKDYPEELPGSCLVAISGDCSGNGMGPNNDVLPFDDRHQGIVTEFLRAQLEQGIHFQFSGPVGRNGDPLDIEREKKLMERFWDAAWALRQAGIFKHKWHSRTRWELAYLGEIAEVKRFHPYEIVTELAGSQK